MRLHNRLIKATFWTDPDLLRWPREQRWFYAGMAQLADDSGCLEESPFAFKLQLFPSPLDSDITVEQLEQWTNDLVTQGKLLRYESNGKKCLYMTNFHKHQELRSPSSPDTPLPPWIKWVASAVKRRSGSYEVVEPYGHRTVTVQSPYGDQRNGTECNEMEVEGKDTTTTILDKVAGELAFLASTTNEAQQDTIRSILEWGMEREAIEYAIQLKREKSAGFEYLRTILDSWKCQGLKTVEQVHARKKPGSNQQTIKPRSNKTFEEVMKEQGIDV